MPNATLNYSRINEAGQIETVPQFIPATLQTVFTGDCHIVAIHLVNESGSAVTVTIMDMQTTPRAVVPPAISLSAGTDMIWEFGGSGRLCPGGLTWVASAANAVTGYARTRA